jgi:DnaK suppressor protein
MTFSLLWRYSIQMPDSNATDEEAVRVALLGMRKELRDMMENAGENTAPVELDQTQQGRLSRMDAMQQQAMADETQRRRHVRLVQIDAALARLDDGEYGYCVTCGEEINADRLALDPAIALCLRHAR